MCPIGLSGSIRSAMILKMARRGTASSAPGIPQIVCQKNKETITRTGFRVKRLASNMGVICARISRLERCAVFTAVSEILGLTVVPHTLDWGGAVKFQDRHVAS